MNEFNELVRLVQDYGALGPNARRVLLALAERLVVGIPHGDFDKPHDWDKESSEEALDLAVYQAAKLLGLGEAEEPKRKGRPTKEFVDEPSHSCDGYDCRKCFFERLDKRKAEKAAFVPEDGPGGHEFFNGKKYTRFHEDAGLNLRVTLVDDDGRTPDGMPWVPPAGARVRVVFQPPHGKGRSSRVIEGQTLTVTTAECFRPDFADIGFNEHKNGELRHCRVVPA